MKPGGDGILGCNASKGIDGVTVGDYKENLDENIADLVARLKAKFGLTISEEKSRIIAFGRYACQEAKKQGRKCATFDSLGFSLRTSAIRPEPGGMVASAEAKTGWTLSVLCMV